MNYNNEKFADVLKKIDKRKLLLLDFGKFDKEGYSYVCQDFDEGLYHALVSILDDLGKYKKLLLVHNKFHMHPQSSKSAYINFCNDYMLEIGILDEITVKTTLLKDFFYLVIKQVDVVKIIKQGRQDGLQPGKDYG